MWNVLGDMMKTFMNNVVAMNLLEILLLTSWVSFTAYASWYFISAKHHVPLTREEATLLWKIHKSHTPCSSKKWYEIRGKDKIIGFECECGYKHLQKRRII